MADMILLGLAVICTAYFMIIVFMPEWEPLLPLSGFSLRLYAYFLYMEMVLQEKYGPHPQVGAGKHCYYMYCRCSYYGSVLHPGVYGGSGK